MREQSGYDHKSQFTVQLKQAGKWEAQLEVAYQGCKKSLCYMPQREQHALPIVIDASAAAPSADEGTERAAKGGNNAKPDVVAVKSAPATVKKSPPRIRLRLQQPQPPTGATVTITIDPEWHISKDFLEFFLPMDETEFAIGNVELPVAEVYNDPNTGLSREEYAGTLTIEVPITGPAKSKDTILSVKYQACKVPVQASQIHRCSLSAFPYLVRARRPPQLQMRPSAKPTPLLLKPHLLMHQRSPAQMCLVGREKAE